MLSSLVRQGNVKLIGAHALADVTCRTDHRDTQGGRLSIGSWGVSVSKPLTGTRIDGDASIVEVQVQTKIIAFDGDTGAVVDVRNLASHGPWDRGPTSLLVCACSRQVVCDDSCIIMWITVWSQAMRRW